MTTAYDQLGGDAVMEPLLRDFYFVRLPSSPIAHLFPPEREETFRKQVAFQRMYWGGPDDYTPWRGHPRMRARHLPFPIGQGEADVWMACMEQAVTASAMPSACHAPFLTRLRQIAQAMINQRSESADDGAA